MLGDYVADHLQGITVLTAASSFILGVIVAYFIWGTRYFRVLEAESSTIMLRHKAEQLRKEQQRQRTRIDSVGS